MSIWLDFRVDDDECDHQQDVYQGCPLCANDKLQAEIDVLRKHQERLRKWVADGQAEIDECMALLEEVREAEYLYSKLHGTVMPKVDALLSKHKGE